MYKHYMDKQTLLNTMPNIGEELLFWDERKEKILFTTALREGNTKMCYIKALTENALKALDYFFDSIGFHSIFEDIDNNYTEETLRNEIFYFDSDLGKWTTKTQALERLKLFEF